jgi:hypothetical protein
LSLAPGHDRRAGERRILALTWAKRATTLLIYTVKAPENFARTLSVSVARTQSNFG